MSLFIIGHMGLFFYTKISSIISIGDLPTTNIIEPLIFGEEDGHLLHFYVQSYSDLMLGKYTVTANTQ
ncbi:hypothetical protein GM535_05325 [Streptococcus pneumoniae]|uniref:Uncharacterized protein n=1 Tax=Streptococcus pneumoniae TaxID=1313 RepID=A0AAW9W3Y5_STREE|nr:hypothetical protein [Streptococcus pneumoniae]MTV76722.1 hypothetical protein [Streptococcus pneumoniae]